MNNKKLETYSSNPHNIQYKYEEDRILAELAKYVDSTYGEHYATGKIETSEFIIDSGYGEGFLIGNIIKYAQRYQKKGDVIAWRKDLMKVLHYGLMAVYLHDRNYNESTSKKEGPREP